MIRQIPVPLPPVDEQRRIVELLEDHLSRLDAADAYLKSSRRRLLAMERSVLGELHRGPTKRLVELAVGSGYGTSERCVVDGLGSQSGDLKIWSMAGSISTTRSVSRTWQRIVSGSMLDHLETC